MGNLLHAGSNRHRCLQPWTLNRRLLWERHVGTYVRTEYVQLIEWYFLSLGSPIGIQYKWSRSRTGQNSTRGLRVSCSSTMLHSLKIISIFQKGRLWAPYHINKLEQDITLYQQLLCIPDTALSNTIRQCFWTPFIVDWPRPWLLVKKTCS